MSAKYSPSSPVFDCPFPPSGVVAGEKRKREVCDGLCCDGDCEEGVSKRAVRNSLLMDPYYLNSEEEADMVVAADFVGIKRGLDTPHSPAETQVSVTPSSTVEVITSGILQLPQGRSEQYYR